MKSKIEIATYKASQYLKAVFEVKNFVFVISVGIDLNSRFVN